MVVETMWPEYAPWWLNMFIWMATFWYIFMASFVPAFYIAVVKLFGFPLLQRWQQEVFIMLYPNKVSFRKITQQWDQYVVDGKGVYWPANTLQPRPHEAISPQISERLDRLKKKYEMLKALPNKTKKQELEMQKILKRQLYLEKQKFVVNPVNTLHIFYHSVNQEVYDTTRRDTKTREILHGNSNRKLLRLRKHSVWLMQNLKAHFHRHYVLITNPTFTEYQLLPVKDRQQFGYGFWHSLGIRFTMIQEEEKKQEEEETSSSNTSNQELVLLPPLSMSQVIQTIRFGQSYQNFSANKMYNILFERRAPLERNFWSWITGSLTKEELMLIFVMVGAVASIALIFLMFHGSPPPSAPGTPAPTGVKIL